MFFLCFTLAMLFIRINSTSACVNFIHTHTWILERLQTNMNNFQIVYKTGENLSRYLSANSRHLNDDLRKYQKYLGVCSHSSPFQFSCLKVQLFYFKKQFGHLCGRYQKRNSGKVKFSRLRREFC